MSRSTLAFLLALSRLTFAQDPVPGEPLEIELRDSDPALEGHGPSIAFEVELTFDGTLFVWAASSELDPILLAGNTEGALLGEDDDSGGGTSACLELAAAAGKRCTITVAAAEAQAIGKLTLHLGEAPETDATTKAVTKAVDAQRAAESARAAGGFERAREIVSEAIAALLAVPGVETSARAQQVLWRLARAASDLGDLPSSRAALESVLAFRSRMLPPDHGALQLARENLGIALWSAGERAAGRVLFEQVLESRTRTLPADDPELQDAQQNHAIALKGFGDLRGARELEQSILEVRTRTLPDDHPLLQEIRQNLAKTSRELGDLVRARELEEQALEVLSRSLPDDHPHLLAARGNLAITLKLLGDLHRARELEERVLEIQARVLPDDHPVLQIARLNLAGTMKALGDLHGARELEEQVLEVRTRTLPDDHPELQSARSNLAGTLADLGDRAAARKLGEQVLEVFSRSLPDDHPDLVNARHNLAVTCIRLGSFTEARELLEGVLEVDSRVLAEDDLKLQIARLNLAAALDGLGDQEGARALTEEALASLSDTVPEGHPVLHGALGSLAWTLAGLDPERGCRAGRDAAVRMRSNVSDALGRFSPRELEEHVTEWDSTVSTLLSLSPGIEHTEAERTEAGAALERELFALVEAVRSSGLLAAAVARAMPADPWTKRSREQELLASAELARLARSGGERGSIQSARRELDLLRRERMQRIAAQARALLDEPTPEALARRLGPTEAMVAYRRYRRMSRGGAAIESLLANVLRSGGELVRVELGPLAAIEAAATDWRRALGAGSEPGRGESVEREDAAGSLDDGGEALRRLVFDPLLSALDGVETLIVALDGPLHAIPIESLPWRDGRLGDLYSIELRLSLRELLWPEPAAEAELPVRPALLVSLGAASFDAEPADFGAQAETEEEAAIESAAVVSRATPETVAAFLRGSAWERGFRPLDHAGAEARGVAALYEQVFPREPRAVVLEERKASKQALMHLAPSARYLHVATHGWSASGSPESGLHDSALRSSLAMSLEEQVRGTSPMLLSGLALAGANLPEDDLGRVGGLVTAEEIASWDLSRCELAVLSACDTGTGDVRLAGQGVASLQKALHMAGARSVITSLWKVPDEATKELMLDFYRRLWVERKPKWQALWEAKKRLREAKDESGALLYSTRDWAAWVLTGVPR